LGFAKRFGPLAQPSIGFSQLAVSGGVFREQTGCDAEPFNVIELDDTLQLDCAGPPVQLSWTVWLNPPAGLKLTE